MPNENLPANIQKPSLSEWIESILPFQLPAIPLVRTANNLDKALARIVAASGENIGSRIERGTANAKSEAQIKAIAAAGDAAATQIHNGGDFAERAINYTFNESLLKQESREKIIELACDELKEAPPKTDAETEIAPDWLNQFARLAENVSSDDLRSLWGKILAGEIKRPGTISVRTLQAISVMSRKDAEHIHRTLSFAIGEFIFRDGYTSETSVRDAVTSEHLGIISGVEGLLSISPPVKIGIASHFVCGDLAVTVVPEKGTKLSIPACPLTPLGQELLAVSGKHVNRDAYMKSFGRFLKDQQIGTVKLQRLGNPNPDGSFPILSEETF